MAAYSFKVQKFLDPKDNLARAQLFFLSYHLVDKQNGLKLYLKRKPGDSKESEPVEPEYTAEETAEAIEKSDGDLM
jgi:hypothetical protein